MTVNLLELVQGQLGGSIVSRLGGLLGEDPNRTQSAINGAVPSIIGGLMKQVATPSGADALATTLEQHDGGILDNLADLIAAGGKDLASVGSALVANLFGGGNLNTVIDSVVKTSGIGKSASRSLLGMLAPIVMGVLGKHVATQKLGTGAIAKLITSQGPMIAGSLPAGLDDSLGIGNLLGGLGQGAGQIAGQLAGQASGRLASATRGAQRSADHARREGSSMAVKLLGLALLALLGWFGWQMFNQEDGPQAAEYNVTDITDSLPGLFTGTTDALSGVTDVETARQALPKLGEVTDRLGAFTTGFMSFSEQVQAPIRDSISGFLPQLKGLAADKLSIEGVNEVLAPAVDSLTGALETFLE